MASVMFDAARDQTAPRWWTRYTVGRGRIERRRDGIRLLIEDAEAGVLADVQLDDYHGRRERALPWGPPVRLEVRARWSHPRPELRGTSGFGFWNDPVDAAGRFVAAPNCLWFFHASEPSRLRIRDGTRGEGFVAGTMRVVRIPWPLLRAGNLALRLPGVGRLATRIGEQRVGGGAVLLPPDLDLTVWHDFALEWAPTGARFAVDGVEVAAFGPDEVPSGPLGFVVWIDNNWAALEPAGRYRAGRLAATGRQWLELGRVAIVGLSDRN